MPKITIKPRNGIDEAPSRVTILKTLCDSGVQVTSIRSNNGVHHVYYSEDCDTDILFSEVCVAALFAVGCEPVLPPQIKAKRTVILRNLDPLIYEHEVDNIKIEIERFIVDDIYKFSNHKMLKVTFTTQQMAKRCVENGAYMYSLRVPPRNINVDRYIEIVTCYRCFKLDGHTSHSCDKDINYKVCSLCSASNHTSRECSATVKKCLNCGGPHSTLAMACPNRKKIIHDKRKEQTTYAGTVTGNSGAAAPKAPSNLIQDMSDHFSSFNIAEVISKSTICVVIASMKSKENNTSFEQVLNELLVASGLSTFNMGNVSPPRIIPEPLHERGDGASAQTNINSKSSTTTTVDSRSSNDDDTQPAVSEVNDNTITVYKKRGSARMCSDNIDKLLAEKKFVLESNLDAMECIKLMKDSITVADIIEVPVSRFNEKLGAVSHRSGVVPVN